MSRLFTSNASDVRFHDIPSVKACLSLHRDWQYQEMPGYPSFSLSQFKQVLSTVAAKISAPYFSRSNQLLGLHYDNNIAKKLGLSENMAGFTQRIIPPQWMVSTENPYCISYLGHEPAKALDALLHGPSVIDCGMFTQLAMLLTIRECLGDVKFNALFGRWPLTISQLNYSAISDPEAPHKGNAIFGFFDQVAQPGEVSVAYIPNHPNYVFKHPAGSSAGHNSIVIDDKAFIFSPQFGQGRACTFDQVKAFLANGYNADVSEADNHWIEKFQTDLEAVELRTGVTHAMFVEKNLELSQSKLGVEELPNHFACAISFNFDRFLTWANRVVEAPTYQPLQTPVVSAESLSLLPHENQKRDFSNTLATFAQVEHHRVTQENVRLEVMRFLQFIFDGKSALLVLAGMPGVGKSAFTACAAKELWSRQKPILFITGNMIKQQGVASIAEKLNNYSVVIMDDNNKDPNGERELLEALCKWYASGGVKHLLITSNCHDFSYEQLFGIRLDRTFNYPPGLDILSEKLTNIVTLRHLTAPSLRIAAFNPSVLPVGGASRIHAFLALENASATSKALWVRPDDFSDWKDTATGVSYEHVVSISYDVVQRLQSIANTLPGTQKPTNIRPLCSAHPEFKEIYNQLTKEQRRILTVENNFNLDVDNENCYQVFIGIKSRRFSLSTDVMVMEIDAKHEKFENSDWFQHMIHGPYDANVVACLHQAFDSPNKKVVFINKSSLTHEELHARIINTAHFAERERLGDRMRVLFGLRHMTANPSGKLLAERGFLSCNIASAATSAAAADHLQQQMTL